MPTIISIDGGTGRVLTSIPSLLKYHKNNPDYEWYVVVYGSAYWMWGFPELQSRVFDVETKGIMDLFWKADEVITPEPYRIPGYYRQEISLREAFDRGINHTKDHSDLPSLQLRISFQEKRFAQGIILDVEEKQQKTKTIVVQPYGRGAIRDKLGVFDSSLRSIPDPMLNYFISNLSKDYNLILMCEKQFGYEEFQLPFDPHLRDWAAIIGEADYFIGCDSCGQHMCKALNKKASVMVAGTHPTNVSYKDFHIIERDSPFHSESMRISQVENNLATRLNQSRIEFTRREIEDAYEQIVKNIDTTYISSPHIHTERKGIINYW